MKLVILRVSFVDRDRPEDERQDAESTPPSLTRDDRRLQSQRKAAGCRTRAASCCCVPAISGVVQPGVAR
jgi:hypothetical protein